MEEPHDPQWPPSDPERQERQSDTPEPTAVPGETPSGLSRLLGRDREDMPVPTPRPAAQPQATDEPATQLARIPAALAGGQSVLSNGEFSRGFTEWAKAGASTGCDLPIGVSILDYDQPNSNVLQIKTNRWVNCNMSGLKRSLNLRVPDDSEVVLAADVKSIYSDVRNACGDWGDEMPLLLELSYLTAGGDTRSISWKFTHKTGGTCERLTGWHDVGLRSRSAIISGDRDREFGETITVPMNTWFAFTSQDVKALDDSMATITQFSVVGAGWDYQSQVDNITLSVGSAATEAPTSAPTVAASTPAPTAAPMRAADDHGDTPSSSTLIPGGSEWYGSIEDGDDVDFFSFRARGGFEYVIETRLGSNPDTQLTIYDPEGATLERHDDSGSGGGERMVWRGDHFQRRPLLGT